MSTYYCQCSLFFNNSIISNKILLISINYFSYFNTHRSRCHYRSSNYSHLNVTLTRIFPQICPSFHDPGPFRPFWWPLNLHLLSMTVKQSTQSLISCYTCSNIIQHIHQVQEILVFIDGRVCLQWMRHKVLAMILPGSNNYDYQIEVNMLTNGRRRVFIIIGILCFTFAQ